MRQNLLGMTVFVDFERPFFAVFLAANVAGKFDAQMHRQVMIEVALLLVCHGATIAGVGPFSGVFALVLNQVAGSTEFLVAQVTAHRFSRV